MRFPPYPRAASRGFTLIELMVVVVIIAILATIAVPQFTARMRERRVREAASTVADVYRGARTRALGRGAAVLVMFKSDGTFEVREGVKGRAAATAAGTAECGTLPTRGCTTNDWTNLGGGSTIGTARWIGGLFASAQHTKTVQLGATTVTTLNVCFNPSGRAFVNETSTLTPGAWRPLTNIVTVTAASTGGRSQRALILPNGTARLAL